jgi:hypothetical protein
MNTEENIFYTLLIIGAIMVLIHFGATLWEYKRKKINETKEKIK